MLLDTIEQGQTQALLSNLHYLIDVCNATGQTGMQSSMGNYVFARYLYNRIAHGDQKS